METEYSQNRDGSYDVYRHGDWIGMLRQLPSGLWAFVSRFADVVGIGMSMEGAIYEAERGIEQGSSAAAYPC